MRFLLPLVLLCLTLGFDEVATIGTTSSGAHDDLSEIRKVGGLLCVLPSQQKRTDVRPAANDYPSLWVHVDAAWAGVALACPELRKELYLDDINAFAHSFCTNFHKVRILKSGHRTECYRQGFLFFLELLISGAW